MSCFTNTAVISALTNSYTGNIPLTIKCHFLATMKWLGNAA